MRASCSLRACPFDSGPAHHVQQSFRQRNHCWTSWPGRPLARTRRFHRRERGSKPRRATHTGVVELVDTPGSDPGAHCERAGATPVPGTTPKRARHGTFSPHRRLGSLRILTFRATSLETWFMAQGTNSESPDSHSGGSGGSTRLGYAARDGRGGSSVGRVRGLKPRGRRFESGLSRRPIQMAKASDSYSGQAVVAPRVVPRFIPA